MGQNKCSVWLAERGKSIRDRRENRERSAAIHHNGGKQVANHSRTQYRHQLSTFMGYSNEVTRGTY